MIFTCFYTRDTFYEDEAARLRKSLHRFGLLYDFRGIPDRGSWASNAGFTAQFLCDILEEFRPHDVVYLNADSFAWQRPQLLLDLTPDACDIAIHRCAWGQLANGTMYLSNSEKCRSLIANYRDRVVQHPDHRDEQRFLDLAIKRAKHTKISQLPASYCYIGDMMAPLAQNEIVIEQLQASRQMKNSTRLPYRMERLKEIDRCQLATM